VELMPTIRFNIGEAFPSDDAVACFVTVVAMMSNDCQRSVEVMVEAGESPDSGAQRLMLFRQQAAIVWESAEYIRKAQQEHPEVVAFIEALPQHAEAKCDQILGCTIPASPHYLGSWLATSRNTTFHYPKPNRQKWLQGKEEIQSPLAKAASKDGIVNLTGTQGDTRFWFADEVIAQWFQESHVDMQRPLLAIPEFAEMAFHAYSASRPGLFTYES
jgi:hypothetical protein